jgi:hypothetical protein
MDSTGNFTVFRPSEEADSQKVPGSGLNSPFEGGKGDVFKDGFQVPGSRFQVPGSRFKLVSD